MILLPHCVLLSVDNPTGQDVLAGSTTVTHRRVLAASPHLSGPAADRLARDKDAVVSRLALGKATDPELLARHACGVGGRAAAAVRNPLTPADALEEAARAGRRREVLLGALANPTLGEDVRRELLTPPVADEIISVGGSSADVAVRALALAQGNPWLGEDAGRWSVRVRRGVCSLTTLPAEQAPAAARGRARLKPHPSTLDTRSWNLAAYARYGHPAADMYVVDHPEFTLDLARLILGRKAMPPEAYVVGRIGARFGMRAVELCLDGSATRLLAAAWVCPAMMYQHYWRPRRVDTAAVQRALEPLGEDRTAWETLSGLLVQWSGRVEQLVEASLAL